MEIRFDTNQEVEIEILDFDVENNYDYLDVYNGPGGPRLAELTGNNNAGKTFTSTDWHPKGNAIALQWNSDSGTREKGFKLIAKAGNANITI